MKRPGKKGIVILVAGGLALVAVLYGGYRLGRATTSVNVQVYPSGATSARIVEAEDGRVVYELRTAEGEWETMEPVEFAEAVWDEHQSRTLGQRLMLRSLNISSTATVGWVLLGLVGQVLFAGRMVVQWLASEKAKASVIPNAFWWMALGGASMLLIYFVWRKDVVGILGQTTGWMIYSRNLYFIYIGGRKTTTTPEKPAEEEPPADPVVESGD